MTNYLDWERPKLSTYMAMRTNGDDFIHLGDLYQEITLCGKIPIALNHSPKVRVTCPKCIERIRGAENAV